MIQIKMSKLKLNIFDYIKKKNNKNMDCIQVKYSVKFLVIIFNITFNLVAVNSNNLIYYFL